MQGETVSLQKKGDTVKVNGSLSREASDPVNIILMQF